jgi:hypothetical protein
MEIVAAPSDSWECRDCGEPADRSSPDDPGLCVWCNEVRRADLRAWYLIEEEP